MPHSGRPNRLRQSLSSCAVELPPHADSLVGREREIASIVYEQGGSTARDVQAELSVSLSNSAVRSMLMRLAQKGVLRVARGHRGPGNPSIYFPTVISPRIKSRALLQLSEDYFDGSLLRMAMEALALLKDGSELAGERPDRVDYRVLEQIVGRRKSARGRFAHKDS